MGREKEGISFIVHTDVSVYSGECKVHKTERFIKETARFNGVDGLISHLADGITANLSLLDDFFEREHTEYDCFKLTAADELTFFIKFGCQIFTEFNVERKDIVFFKYLGDENSLKRNDPAFLDFLKKNKTFSATLTLEKDIVAGSDFKKLYRLSNSDKVNFPLLNERQKKIVETEDQNVLVQGVAGSGKTNVCIDKIIFSACREYAGRVLYSTFSRGLLIDTQSRVVSFTENLRSFITAYDSGKLIFTDKNHKKAIENKLGVYFSVDDDEKIYEKIKRIIAFLENKVDYFLLEDLYNEYVGNGRVVSDTYFIKDYIKGIKNHQLSGRLAKVKNLSYEVIYKEIYGLIFGCYDMSAPSDMLTLAEYTERRKDSFTRPECEVIYSLARDYGRHLESEKLLDNNRISRILMKNLSSIPKYSLAILDEVQDMTEVNLCLIKKISAKMFCVGDALQMINPSFFSFAYLKRLLFEKDIISVAELANNYRNTRKIAEIIDSLAKINVAKFGTHSFVLKGESVDSEVSTSTVFVEGGGFIEEVAKQRFDNFTVIVASSKRKEELRKILKNQEILTVSEIKGLERDTAILYDILSDNIDKWEALDRTLVNRKQADENSVYRYYFNLFYVGLSRARMHVYVAEDKRIAAFSDFFKENFDRVGSLRAVENLTKIVSTVEIDAEELYDRVTQFTNLGQYDNARFTAAKIADGKERNYLLAKIDITENYIQHGAYKEAGIRFWEKEFFEDARKMFTLSNDTILIELLDACTAEGGALGVDIIQYYPQMEGNAVAQKFILETAKNDLKALQEQTRSISKALRTIKEKKNG